MSAGSWVLYLGLVLAAAGFVLWVYLRREVPGRGRLVLAGLRLGTLALVLLLLFDPSLPGARAGPGGSRELVLLDASASMALPERAGAPGSRWDAARREAERQDGPILLFGDVARPVARDSLPAVAPGDVHSRLRPALAAAAEAGAERVRVLTDGALEDAAALGGWLARLGLGVEWVRFGEGVPGLGITGLEAAPWVQAGEPLELEAGVTAGSGAPDSARLVVRQGGRVLAEAAVQSPAPGRTARVRMPVRPVPPRAPGYVPLDIALEPGDAVSADDRRRLSVFVSPDPAGIAVISLQPDWEPRFLLPVLQRALGLPARGFLRVGDAWLRLAEGAEAGERAAESDVARIVTGAALVVLHAPGADPPAWVLEALRSAPRLLVLPAGAATAGLPLPLTPGEPERGDWFVAPTLPASPVAPLLGDVPAAELTPLPTLRRTDSPARAWAPLMVTRGPGGETAPLLLAGEAEGRRWAVALGDGYWRWAFRGGEPRLLYDRLWAAVAGWLVREQAVEGEGVWPVRRVVQLGEAPAWLSPGLRPDSIRLRLTGEGAVRDTVLRPAPDDSVRGPVLEPGEYRYAATAYGGDRTAEGSGELFVEHYSPELWRPVAALEDITATRAVGTSRAPASDRPLHASPLPYVLIVLLLATEWILRRRWGLR